MSARHHVIVCVLTAIPKRRVEPGGKAQCRRGGAIYITQACPMWRTAAIGDRRVVSLMRKLV